MNFVFISPNYPDIYWMFCRGLKKYGAKVLAIVDTSYDSLQKELKEFCDECYVVKSFNDYDEMVKALGYYTFKYGKIDWIESNNEAWLTLDAKLRDDFNVKTGFSFEKIDEFQSKAAMKKYYAKAGVPTARYYLVEDLDGALKFAKEVGYPLVLKPDHGVGASFTYKCLNEDDLKNAYQETTQYHMILEEFVNGDVFTLDGVCDKNSDIQYLNSMIYVGNCMDSVNNAQAIGTYTALKISDSDKDIIKRTIKAFELKNRFFHAEFFRLKEDKEGLGKRGDVLGLEINFRPPGGICPDMMNYASDIDVFDIWAKVLLTEDAGEIPEKKYCCGFAGRRNAEHYKYTVEEITSEFKDEILYVKYLDAALAAGMGDVLIVGRWSSEERTMEFYNKALETID